MQYIEIIVVAFIVILLAKFILNLSPRGIRNLIFNALAGFIIIWLVNYLGIVSIPLNIITILVSGIFGAPGVILLILLSFMGII